MCCSESHQLRWNAISRVTLHEADREEIRAERVPPKPKAAHTSGQEKTSVTALPNWLNTPFSKECVVCVSPWYNGKKKQKNAGCWSTISKFIWQSMCISLFSLPISLKSSGWRIRWSLETTQSFVRSPIRAFARWRSVNLAASTEACTPAEPRTPRERPPFPASWRSNVGVFGTETG